jgi:FkbM family methyltransferase
MSMAHEGVLVGLSAGPDGRPQLTSLPWRGNGFTLRPSDRPIRRVGLFADKPRAQLELPLPAGEWGLVFYRHDWSGHVLVRDVANYTLYDLFCPPPQFNEYEVRVSSVGPESPVVVEVAAQRNRDARAGEVWLLEVRKATTVFHPEAGRALTSTCRLIEGRHGHFLALRTDVGVADQLASTGMWEQGQIELFSRLVRSGETVLDVGANIGHHTVALSRMVGETGRVIAFEPQMQMFNLLNANIVLNRCRNVLPFKLAVGRRADRTKMRAVSYDDFLPFGSLGLQRPDNADSRGEDVEVILLDDFLPTFELDGSPVSLMKVDVQAHELYMFQGAVKQLRQAQPSISFEVSPFWMRKAGYDWREVLVLLQDLGYSFFDEAGKPLETPEWDGQSRAEWQFVAVAPRYRDRLV